MGSRLIKRCSLEPHVVEKLENHDIYTVKDFFTRTKWDLVEILDAPMDQVTQVVFAVAKAVAPEPVTCDDLKRNQAYRHGHLKTPLLPLDESLRGGLSPGTITEIVGAAGMGKTQFCLCMAVISCLDSTRQGKVLYIDTENKFSGERLVEIARKRFPENFSRKGSMEDMLDRIIVKVPSSSLDLLQMLQGLQTAVIALGINLIIIDSIAALVRADFGPQDIPQRQKLLGQQASALKLLAESFQIPVLVTNQITTKFNSSSGGNDTGSLVPALGPMWAHAVNTRLTLSREEGHFSRGVLHLAKSSLAACIDLPYIITAGGFELDE